MVASADVFECPECKKEGTEKTFARAQALGAHRSRVHGVQGGSRTSQRRQGRRNGAGAQHHLDRDSLLATVFPNGLPPRADVIRRAGAWLDEAERLVKS